MGASHVNVVPRTCILNLHTEGMKCCYSSSHICQHSTLPITGETSGIRPAQPHERAQRTSHHGGNRKHVYSEQLSMRQQAGRHGRESYQRSLKDMRTQRECQVLPHHRTCRTGTADLQCAHLRIQTAGGVCGIITHHSESVHMASTHTS